MRAGSSARTEPLRVPARCRARRRRRAAPRDAAGDGGIGTPSGMTSAISERSRQPRSREEVVHQQRGLARRRRALERRRRHADDHPAAVEVGQHVAQRERAGHRVELVAALDQPGRGRRVEVGAERDDQDVGVERRRRRSRPAWRPGRSTDRGLHEAHARLDEVAVRVEHRRRPRSARTSRRAWRSRRRSRRSGRSGRPRRRRRTRRTTASSARGHRSRHPAPGPARAGTLGGRRRPGRSGRPAARATS